MGIATPYPAQRSAQLPDQSVGTSVVIVGDSMTVRCHGYGPVTSISRSSNVATATLTGHGIGSGQPIDIDNATDNTFNVRDTAITYLTANTFSYPSIGPDGSATAKAGRVLVVKQQQHTRDEGYWTWLQSKTGGALRLVKNAGVASDTTDALLARLGTDVLAYASDWVFFQPCLYNDVQAGYTTSQVTGYINSVVSALRAAGRKVLLIGPIGLSSSHSAAKVQVLMGAQRYMRALAQSMQGVYFAEPWRYVVNPVAGTAGNGLSAMLASDNIHESPQGAERKAQAIVDAIGGLIPRMNLLVASNADNYGASSSSPNIWDYGPWTASGGTVTAPVTGTSAGGLLVDSSATGTFVASCPARSDGVGYNQRVVATSSAANDYCRIRAVTPVSSSRFAAGDKLRATCAVDLTGISGSNFKAINAYLVFAGTVTNTSYVLVGGAAAAANFIQTDQSLVLIGSDITVPSDGITSVDFRMQFLFSAAGTPLTIDVGRISLEKV